MFSNIGYKIQILAKVICGIGIALSVILGFVTNDAITVIIGFLGSWTGCFVLYGFGDLIQTVHEIKDSICPSCEIPLRKISKED